MICEIDYINFYNLFFELYELKERDLMDTTTLRTFIALAQIKISPNSTAIICRPVYRNQPHP